VKRAEIITKLLIILVGDGIIGAYVVTGLVQGWFSVLLGVIGVGWTFGVWEAPYSKLHKSKSKGGSNGK